MFPAKAIELVRTVDQSVPHIVRDLCIYGQALHHWIKRADIDTGRGQLGELTTPEREELWRKAKTLREKREIPLRAEACFARETL